MYIFILCTYIKKKFGCVSVKLVKVFFTTVQKKILLLFNGRYLTKCILYYIQFIVIIIFVRQEVNVKIYILTFTLNSTNIKFFNKCNTQNNQVVQNIYAILFSIFTKSLKSCIHYLLYLLYIFYKHISWKSLGNPGNLKEILGNLCKSLVIFENL